MIRVALVTKADLIIHGLREILSKTADISLVGITGDLVGCKALALQKSPNVVIIDAQSIEPPQINQIKQVVDDFRPLTASINFISITDWSNKNRFDFARQLGIKGHCLKTISSSDMVEAIRTVARGETYIHSHYMKQIHSTGNGYVLNSLGARQQEILNLLLLGHTNREIADILYLSPETVKSHIKVILRKLKVRDRTQAVSLVLREMMNAMALENQNSGASYPITNYLPPQKEDHAEGTYEEKLCNHVN
ncbi:MAG: response regulator transcription factor [Firmicutes bacterium]|nr:response regulator transcription factor [Bacillota bacterium]